MRLFLPLPPPPQLRLHHAVEVLLSSVDELIRTLLPDLPPTVVLPALLRPTPLLQPDLSLSSLQDLLSLRLALKRLQTNMELSTVFMVFNRAKLKNCLTTTNSECDEQPEQHDLSVTNYCTAHKNTDTFHSV